MCTQQSDTVRFRFVCVMWVSAWLALTRLGLWLSLFASSASLPQEREGHRLA